MTNLVPVAENTPVPQLEKTDRATGGPGGVLNAQAQALANQIEDIRQNDIKRIDLAQASGHVGYATLAALNADLSKPDGALAEVTNDATSDNNGVYRKSGASGTGSWVKSADRVTELSASMFAFRGQISAGASLATANQQGVYYGAPNAGYTDLPLNLSPTASFTMLVYDMNGQNGRWQHQEIRRFSPRTNVWWRILDRNNPTANPWVEGWVADGGVTTSKLADSSVTPSKLAFNYSYRGELSAGSANSITTAGRHLVTAQLSDMPTGAPAGGYLDVSVHGNYVTQEFSALTNPAQAWRRSIRIDNSTYYPWTLITPAASLMAGKTIAFVGDSITENGDYPERVVARLGGALKKFGFGGCRMGKHNTNTDGLIYDKMCMHKLAEYINAGDFSELTQAANDLYAYNGDDNRPQAAAFAATDWGSVDHLVIFFGTNDWGGNLPLGAITDSTGDSFRGAINHVVQKITSKYPKIKIAFIAPMWRARNNAGDGLDADVYPNANNDFLISFTDAVVEMAHLNKLPALDLFRNSGINKYNASTYLVDGLHPNGSAGYQQVADKVASFLQGNC